MAGDLSIPRLAYLHYGLYWQRIRPEIAFANCRSIAKIPDRVVLEKTMLGKLGNQLWLPSTDRAGARIMSPIRRLIIYINSAICTIWFRLRGVHVGVVGCDGHLPILYGRGEVTIGKRLVMRGRLVACEIGAALPSAALEIGDNVFINHGATVIANHHIEIGSNTLIGEFAALYDTNHHPVDSAHSQKYEPVIIGANVWIGRGVIVLPGSKIGDNSVIAAGSVVKGAIPSNVLATGNPAQPVKELTIADGWRRKYGA